MSREPAPLSVKLAAVVALLGLMGMGYQAWQGMPVPARWIPSQPRVIHPALLLQPGAPATEPTTTGLPPAAAIWREHRVRGTDDSGRSVFFRVMVLSPEFRWLPGSTTQVNDGDGAVPLSALPTAKLLADALSSSRAVLAMGSDEETRDGDLLSTDRARNLGKWFERSFAGDGPVFGIDAGRYRPATAPAVEQIGRLVVVGVPVLDQGADLAAALRNALADNEDAPLDVRLYSRFDLLPLDDGVADP